jgi:hypothetical protein
MDQIQAEQTSGAATRQPLVVFHRFVPQARLPQRADRSALGSMPTRAFRYCEAITSAAAFGYYVFSPIDFSLMWDGTSISWTYKGAEGWMPLGSAQFPGFGPHFDATAPEGIQGFAPPFVSAIQEPGLVQLWSGLVVRTAPGTSLLLRAPANLPHKGGYELTRTHAPVEFSAEYPLFQVQPLPRETYADATLNDYELVPNLDQLDGKDWDDYYDTVVRPNVADKRPRGSYAAAARKRRAAEPDPA